MIDLPYYYMPSLKTALRASWNKGFLFLKKVGTVIFILSIIIWFCSNFPRPSSEDLVGKNSQEVQALVIEKSVLGRVGRIIEPVLRPIGLDWKMGVGLLVAFGARELFVSSMGVIYALGDVDEESETLRDRLRKEVNPKTGKPVYSSAVVWSLLIFFVFAIQCTSTLAIVKQETGGWYYPSMMFLYMTLLAYSGSFIIYNVLS